MNARPAGICLRPAGLIPSIAPGHAGTGREMLFGASLRSTKRNGASISLNTTSVTEMPALHPQGSGGSPIGIAIESLASHGIGPTASEPWRPPQLGRLPTMSAGSWLTSDAGRKRPRARSAQSRLNMSSKKWRIGAASAGCAHARQTPWITSSPSRLADITCWRTFVQHVAVAIHQRAPNGLDPKTCRNSFDSNKERFI